MNMLQASRRSYVCWRCALGKSMPSRIEGRSTGFLVGKGKFNAPLYRRVCYVIHWIGSYLGCMAPILKVHSQNLATVQHPFSSASEDGLGKPKEELLPIRERLRTWDEENPGPAQAMLTDFAQEGGLSNSFTRPQNVAMAQFDVSTPLFQGDELGDLRSDDSLLKPGDMVELRYDPLCSSCRKDL